jgi:hypothetical protein
VRPASSMIAIVLLRPSMTDPIGAAGTARQPSMRVALLRRPVAGSMSTPSPIILPGHV